MPLRQNTLSFKPVFHDLVELLLSSYRFLQIHFFPFDRFRPLGRLRVALPLLRGKYRFSATVAYVKKSYFQWLKSTKFGIISIKGRANGWTESGLLVNEMHLREQVHFLICPICRYHKSHRFCKWLKSTKIN